MPMVIFVALLEFWQVISIPEKVILYRMGIRLPQESLTEMNICLMKQLPFDYV